MSKIPTFTKEQYDAFAQAIEDNSYFRESRKFYSVLYMSIMPERCLYVILTLLACTTALYALIGLILLLPIVPTEPLLFNMQNVTRDIPIITPLRKSPYEPVNQALQEFFLKEYVVRRENYSFEKIQAAFRFLRRYSDDNVMNVYRRYIDPNSPRSPINRYEKKATRDVVITAISIKRADGIEGDDYLQDRSYVADVLFEARVISSAKIEISHWKAQVVFDYTQLKMMQPEDQVKGKLKVTPMAFKVTDYNVVEVAEGTK